jgi:hypothetical protein
MFVKVSLAAAFFLMVGAPFAGASESARPIAISTLFNSRSLNESRIIVVAQDDSSDSADNDNDSSDSSDADKDSDSDSDKDGDSDSDQNADQQNAQQQAPDPDAGQVPLNAYPQQVNPNQ